MTASLSQINNPQILFEGTQGSLDYWASNLGAESTDLERLQSQLILRKSTVEGNLSYRLDFVGLICLGNSAFFCLPKIYRNGVDNFIQAIHETLNCLQRYQRNITRPIKMSEAGIGSIFDDAGTIVDMFLSLLDWTRERGFHKDDETIKIR